MKKLLFIIFLFLLPLYFTYAAKPAKVLIVPGHDDESWGTEFLGVKEADMNVKLSLMIYDQLKQDKNFEAFIVRDWDGYKKEFTDYFQNNEDSISKFIKSSKENFNTKILDGKIFELEGVNHNNAKDDVAFKLYGINKWANENSMDAVIHVHFNDYPRGRTYQRGKYKGFAVYVPEPQLKNSELSSPLGFFIFSSLLKNYDVSNYEKESFGVVPDQSLIALGANDTSMTRSVLIEYGYIYERRFSNFYKREAEMKIMSRRTYEGIKKYFNYRSKF